jgi:hypothetical protein
VPHIYYIYFHSGWLRRAPPGQASSRLPVAATAHSMPLRGGAPPCSPRATPGAFCGGSSPVRCYLLPRRSCFLQLADGKNGGTIRLAPGNVFLMIHIVSFIGFGGDSSPLSLQSLPELNFSISTEINCFSFFSAETSKCSLPTMSAIQLPYLPKVDTSIS